MINTIQKDKLLLVRQTLRNLSSLVRQDNVLSFYKMQVASRETWHSKAVFTQRSLSDLTLDRSKFMSDKVCLNTLNRIAKSDR